jgi:hypothetical protein
MSPDEQEARSRRYSNDVIMLLPLSEHGKIAVFNRAGDLCGIVDRFGDHGCDGYLLALSVWQPPATRARPSLEELGL